MPVRQSRQKSQLIVDWLERVFPDSDLSRELAEEQSFLAPSSSVQSAFIN
jgi:hypothetical protein